MQRRPHKSVANISSMSESNLLSEVDLDPVDFPTKVVMRKLKWSNDPRLRINLQLLNQVPKPRPPTVAKDKVWDKRNIGSVAGRRPARFSSGPVRAHPFA